jgi:hypothetical protein
VLTPPAASGRFDPKKNTHVPDAGHVPPGHSESAVQVASKLLPPRHFRGVQVASFEQRRDESLLQRWSSSWPAPACGLGIGPLMAQTPQGRWPAAQLKLTVTAPSLMMGARCEIPVHPVSRTDSLLVGSPKKATVDGQAQLQFEQAKSTPQANPGLEGSQSCGSEPSPQARGDAPGLGVLVADGVTVGVGVSVAIGVGGAT